MRAKTVNEIKQNTNRNGLSNIGIGRVGLYTGYNILKNIDLFDSFDGMLDFLNKEMVDTICHKLESMVDNLKWLSSYSQSDSDEVNDTINNFINNTIEHEKYEMLVDDKCVYDIKFYPKYRTMFAELKEGKKISDDWYSSGYIVATPNR